MANMSGSRRLPDRLLSRLPRGQNDREGHRTSSTARRRVRGLTLRCFDEASGIEGNEEVAYVLYRLALRVVSARVGGDLEPLLRSYGRCCTARSKSLTSLCRLQSHPAQYVSGIPSAAILLSISHPIRCSTRCLANVRARISGPMIAL